MHEHHHENTQEGNIFIYIPLTNYFRKSKKKILIIRHAKFFYTILYGGKRVTWISEKTCMILNPVTNSKDLENP